MSSQSGRDGTTKDTLKGGGEWDVITAARRWYCYTARSKVCKSVKNQINRRQRKDAKREIEEQMSEE